VPKATARSNEYESHGSESPPNNLCDRTSCHRIFLNRPYSSIVTLNAFISPHNRASGNILSIHFCLPTTLRTSTRSRLLSSFFSPLQLVTKLHLAAYVQNTLKVLANIRKWLASDSHIFQVPRRFSQSRPFLFKPPPQSFTPSVIRYIQVAKLFTLFT